MSRPTLLVATAGGHIDELYELVRNRYQPAGGWWWATSRTPQTVSLLEGQDVTWVRPVGSRQAWAMLKSVPQAWSIMRRRRPSQVISTGAALSVPYLLLSRLLGIECIYVESATRLNAPSLTGRIAEFIPGVQLQAQSAAWERRRWELVDGVFDQYVAVERNESDYQSVLVTVGTERFPFPRALEAVSSERIHGLDFSWQTGHTDVPTTLPGTQRAWWSADALTEAARAADVVVTHAGVGSILMSLRAGRLPVLIPRRAARGEHIDDHQVELAHQLQARGLGVVAEPGQPLLPLLEQAAAYTVRHHGQTRHAA